MKYLELKQTQQGFVTKKISNKNYFSNNKEEDCDYNFKQNLFIPKSNSTYLTHKIKLFDNIANLVSLEDIITNELLKKPIKFNKLVFIGYRNVEVRGFNGVPAIELIFLSDYETNIILSNN